MKPNVIGNTFHGPSYLSLVFCCRPNSTGNVKGGVNRDNIEVKGPVFGDVNINSKAAERRKELAEWVSPLDFSSIHAQALGKRTLGTLEWLIASPQFEDWKSSRGGFLWCPGPPGAGKTVFASFVIDLLQKAYYQDPSSVSAVCYIYCQYSKKLSIHELFEVLLRQLILWCPSVETDKIDKMKEQDRRLPLDEITALLQSNFRCFPGMFIVVDALDECFSESDRHHLLQKLRAFSDVNILTTSRDLPHIAEFMQGVARLDIHAIERDIKIHADVQRQRNPRFAELAMRISSTNDKVIAKAAGSFLLADRHIAHLSEQSTERAFLNALDTLPTDAAASHATALGRINQQGDLRKRVAYATLSLLSFALRPLSSLELRHGIANILLNKIASDDELDDEETIVSACAGLVTVNKISEEITFMHYTVQEYLQQVREASDFLSESVITKSFMQLIRSPGMVARPPNHPLIQYATSSWAHHSRRCENDKSVIEMALSLLSDSGYTEILCSNWNPYRYQFSHNHPWDIQAIHLAAASGLTRIGKLFIQQNPQCIDQQDCAGRTPLSWAAGEGHLDTVQMLLQAGNVSMIPIRTTRLKTVLKKCLSEINQLVRQKVQVNRKDHDSRTPLSYAAAHGHTEVVKMFLNVGKVEIDVKGGDGQTPLSLAAEGGHLEIVKMLLDTRKVDIDVKDCDDRTPLLYAARYGHHKVVKMLLDTGKVETNAKDDNGPTPLSLAAQYDHLEVVKVLLDTGKVEINAKDNNSRTPLSLAARSGHLEVVKVLLNTGKVEINAKDDNGQTPLSIAVLCGHLQVVKVLLDTGKVEINAKDNNDRTPFSFAAAYGHLEVMKVLLDFGKVEIDVKDKDGQTPLSYAAEDGHLEVMKVLLGTGKVEINMKGKDGRTLLSLAALYGRLEVVKVLLSTGKVEINAKDDNGQTPLSIAALCGHLQVVKALLDTGKVDTLATDKWDNSPLTYARRRGYSDITRLLQDYHLHSYKTNTSYI